MKVLQLTAKSGADGLLRLMIPAEPGREFDVNVTLESRATTPDPSDPKPDDLGWPPGFFDETFGSIDDETFIRHPQGSAPIREAFD